MTIAGRPFAARFRNVEEHRPLSDIANNDYDAIDFPDVPGSASMGPNAPIETHGSEASNKPREFGRCSLNVESRVADDDWVLN
jgi:hypothetical protein